jgi:two-component system NtrC family sensor kinase
MTMDTTDARARVLFVDDEPNVLEGLLLNLRNKFAVTTAGGGAEGLRVLTENEPFTVILSDFAMPGMNGLEFLTRAAVQAPDTMRLLLTGQASLESAIAAVNNGNIFRFLTKPCSPPTLLRALQDAVAQSGVVTAEREQAKGKLEAMSGHLLRADRLASLGTMAGAVGHELNNALTPFSFAMDFIRQAVAEGRVPSNEDLDVLQQAQEHLSVHASSLLDLGRPARSGAIAETDLGAVAGTVVNMLRSAGLFRRVKVQLDTTAEPIIVAAGRTEVEQVLVNLVKNAVDVLGETPGSGGVIRISVSASASPGMAICHVSDNGRGISEATVPLLFEPYYTTKPPDRGTGLGLYVVRQVIRRAGGEVSVHSEEGCGTTFTFTLPFATETAPVDEGLLDGRALHDQIAVSIG